MGKFQYGGQAVIEGVMMRGPEQMAIAVQKNEEEIVIQQKVITPIAKKYPILGLPILRGSVALIEAMVIGMNALTFSANQVGEEEEEELSTMEIIITIAIAIGLAMLLFVAAPVLITNFLHQHIGDFGRSLVEGVVRISLFVGYVVLIGRMKDIRRVFQYHGAEHKVIHTYEAGQELTVENAKKFSALHPRCGTSFILIVLMLTILVFTFIGQTGPFMRIGIKILLMPLIAGIAYELIKFSGKNAHKNWVKWMITPGLWMQQLTTKEPEDSQIQVAIKALQAVMPQEKHQEIVDEVSQKCTIN